MNFHDKRPITTRKYSLEKKKPNQLSQDSSRVGNNSLMTQTMRHVLREGGCQLLLVRPPCALSLSQPKVLEFRSWELTLQLILNLSAMWVALGYLTHHCT